jgi:hypothetical protein
MFSYNNNRPDNIHSSDDAPTHLSTHTYHYWCAQTAPHRFHMTRTLTSLPLKDGVEKFTWGDLVGNFGGN